MKVVRWVYNALNRFVRRVLMHSSTVMLVFGCAAIALGSSVMLATDNANEGIAFIVIILGIVACAVSFVLANKFDHRELRRKLKESQDNTNMVDGIESLNRNIESLIEEIREDRKQKNKEAHK